MKYSASQKPRTHTTIQPGVEAVPSGYDGIALAPPAYGIDALDGEANAHAPIQRRTAAPATTNGAAEAPQANRTGLPDPLKAGIETLSGLPLDDVRVHYNSSRPAQLHALAYTQGADIHVGPGHERHLPHEAWHVVQQKQGRVRPTLQMKGTAINDDDGLEREADLMGSRAIKSRFTVPKDGVAERLQDRTHHRSVIQRVRGGLEYTEDQPTGLRSYAGGASPAGVNLQHELLTIGGSHVSVFLLADPTHVGVWRDDTFTLVRNGRVRLTNDEVSAEWIIEGHAVDITANQMMDNMKTDLNSMFAMRAQLANKVAALKKNYPNATIALVPGNLADLHTAPDPQGVFVYHVGAEPKGKAQITVQFSDPETIRRIAKLNASKYLPGTKVAEGEDTSRVAGTIDHDLFQQDLVGTTSFSKAERLWTALLANANPIADPAGGRGLSAFEVATIMLMILNDALAATMVRYNAQYGEAQDKNIQRFFPKSRRDSYVAAIAGANLAPAVMNALRVHVQGIAAVIAQEFYDRADAGALRVDEAFGALGAGHANMAGMMAARHAMAFGQVPVAGDVTNIKDTILGVHGALLATWIGRAAEAYTDVTHGEADHYQPGVPGVPLPPGNVIRSTLGFTPVAGANPGAVYEFREREVLISEPTWYSNANIQPALDALRTLFEAS